MPNEHEHPVTRWLRIRQIHHEYSYFYQILGGLVLILIGIFIGVILFSDESHLIKNKGYWTNVFTEVLGIIATIAVLNRFAERRATRQEKRRLILQMGSPDNATAIEAVRILRSEGWLEDGSLKGAYLDSANLEGANLYGANLERVSLSFANLKEATLAESNLKRASLNSADLQDVDFDLGIINMKTILPDGSLWKKGRDMREFTRPYEWLIEQQTKE